MPTVTRIRVHNFRSCEDTEVRLGSFTPVVGYNNAGKSNLLDALGFALNPIKLVFRDFYDPSLPVVVVVEIEGVTEEVLGGLAPNHRAKVEPYCQEGRLVIQRTSATPDTTAASVRTDLLDPERGEWVINPSGINNALKPLFPDPIRIKAMDDAYADASKTGRTSLGQLVKELLSEFDDDLKHRLEGALNDISDVLGVDSGDRPHAFQEADREMSAMLDSFIPGMSVRLNVTAPTFEDLITRGATLLLAEEGRTPRDIGEYGHGTQRTTQMALVQLLARRQHAAGMVRPILLIDEPELYLHPQSVQALRSALKQLAEGGYQVVFTTHTPEMVGRDGFHVAAVVTKRNGTTRVRPSIAEAVEIAVEDASRQDALFAFRNTAEILFSDRVVLVEGKDDKACFDELYTIDRARTLRQQGIGIVELGGVRAAPKLWEVLKAMQVPFLVVTDLDFAFRTGPDLLVGAEIERAHLSDIERCRVEFAQMLADGIPISLDNQGLPCNTKGAIKPNEAFGLLATRKEVVPVIESIHERLKAHGIWVWPCGALEQLLGDHGSKRKSVMRENALSAAMARGIDEAIAEAGLLRRLFDAMENEANFTLGRTPEGVVAVGGIAFVPAPT